MEESLHTILNSKAKIQERLQSGKINWMWPILIVFARFIFAFIAQALVAGIYMIQNHSAPWQAAAPWWVVYGTLIDVGCLVLLWRLAKREGISVKDLISLENHRIAQSVYQYLGFIVLFIVLFMAGGMIFGPLIYGTEPPAPYGVLPLWGALFSVLVWPFVWGITEQLTYMGYALPRIEVLSKRAWIAILIVGFGWCLQHIALPFALDWQWMAYRFASTLPIAVVLPIVYFRTRRLLPFIVAHCIVDAGGTFALVLLPSMQ